MDKRVVENQALLTSALAGLQATPKTLDSKWFYDATGSALFEEITQLEEYYPTRTETAILHDQAARLVRHVPAGATLVELGSGASLKTRILLDALPELGTYVPLDISAGFLAQAAEGLRTAYPGLRISPVVTDFMQGFTLPATLADQRKVAFFPGSTLGNLAPEDAVDLLNRVRNWGQVEAFILGVDLVKDPQTMILAYDDPQGVTAAFNLNILARLNREVGADFALDRFGHEARWNAEAARIEMHLVSTVAQKVQLGAAEVAFAAGESIHTENSRKYTRASITQIAEAAGWQLDDFLTDPKAWFGVCVLTPVYSA